VMGMLLSTAAGLVTVTAKFDWRGADLLPAGIAVVSMRSSADVIRGCIRLPGPAESLPMLPGCCSVLCR